MRPLGDEHRLVHVDDPSIGLTAFIVIDDVTLGPAAGGVRTHRYPSADHALQDARRLARAMTEKCALAALDAGGAKAVIVDHPGLDRNQAFNRLGREVAALDGLFRTAGDLGTTAEDLEVMARHSPWVYTDETGLADAAGRGVVACMRASQRAQGDDRDDPLVLVQGAGSMGAAVTRAAVANRMRVVLADLDEALARRIAEDVGAEVMPAPQLLTRPADILAPCAVGGAIDPKVAAALAVRTICGAANNPLAGEQTEEVLATKGIMYVPDTIASAGAVADGIGRTVMGLTNTDSLIERLGVVAEDVLRAAHAEQIPSKEAARRLAWSRIEAAR